MDPICSHTVSRTRDTCVVVLAGDLDMSVVDEVCSVLVDEASRPGTTSVIVDLDALDFLDASGLSALVTGHNTARFHGRGFAVTHAHGGVRAVLELTGLLASLSGPAIPLTTGNGYGRHSAG